MPEYPSPPRWSSSLRYRTGSTSVCGRSVIGWLEVSPNYLLCSGGSLGVPNQTAGLGSTTTWMTMYWWVHQDHTLVLLACKGHWPHTETEGSQYRTKTVNTCSVITPFSIEINTHHFDLRLPFEKLEKFRELFEVMEILESVPFVGDEISGWSFRPDL